MAWLVFAPRYVLSSVIEVWGGEGIVEGMTGVCQQIDSVQCNRGLGR